ncbi:amino acid or sugar ABC transport system permease protein [Acidiphilium sp. CAG:727]|nr:amino acid or sugar ABC transport system permease protein [Acidiphilium sp. CAG:727]
MIFLIQKTLVYAIPLLIVALAGVFAERSGVINIALDGMMIFGSFVGAIFVSAMQRANLLDGHPQIMYILAMLVSAAAGAIFSLLLSFSAINLKADQTIGGTALNMLAPALCNTFALALFMQEKIEMPKSTNYAFVNSNLNGFLRIFADKAYISTYIAIVIFILLSLWLYKTKTGLRMRACGEHPQAAASVGVNVYKMRYLGTTISGALAGLGGYIYIATVSGGTAEASVAGMGFLALAIMIFGNWKPGGIAFGSLLFGFLTCLGVVSDRISFMKSWNLPMYFYNILPYVIVLVVLALTAKKSGCPKAEGIPYDKGMR